MRKMNVIRSRLHEVFSEEVNKIALSSEDDKRVIMEDGIDTKAYGHYSIPDLLPTTGAVPYIPQKWSSFLMAWSRHYCT